MLFTFDPSKPLWQSKKRGATTPQLKAAAKLVAQADSDIVEQIALQELFQQLPNVNHLALRGALASACQDAGYVKSSSHHSFSTWVKGL